MLFYTVHRVKDFCLVMLMELLSDISLMMKDQETHRFV